MAQSEEMKGPANADTYLLHARKTGESGLTLTEAQSEHQSRYRRAKGAGVDIAAMQLAKRIMTLDTAVGRARIKTLLSYLVWEKAPCVLEGDLFEHGGKSLSDLLGITGPSEKMQDAYTAFQAEAMGFGMGHGGEDLSAIDSIFPQGTPNNQAAAKGWKRGQAAIAQDMAPGASKGKESGKGRRGGRGKKEEAEEEPAAQASGFTGDFDELADDELPVGETEDDQPGTEEPHDEPASSEPPVKASPKIDMVVAQKMTLPDMRRLYSEVTGDDRVAFPTRKVALQHLGRAYELQQDGRAGAMH